MSFLKRFLIPTDFSESSMHVYEYVSWLAKHHGAKVDLIHVVPKMSYLEISEAVMGNPFKVQVKFRELKEKLHDHMKEELDRNIPKPHRGRVFVSSGVKIAEGIMDHTEEEDYDLIVIGSRGKRINGLFKRGSVCLKLVRQAKIPVLSFNKKVNPKTNAVLVPTDGSAVSFEALETALKLAAQFGASVILYSVLEFDYEKITLLGGDPQLSELAAEHQKKEILENLTVRLKSSEEFGFKRKPTQQGGLVKTDKNKTVRLDIVTEQNISAHNAIVDYADKHAELVVMTTHGRTGLSKILLGSVAEKVVQNLQIPVLTVKPEFDES